MTRILQTIMAKFSREKAMIRPQNIGLKAASAKKPHFAHGRTKGCLGLKFQIHYCRCWTQRCIEFRELPQNKTNSRGARKIFCERVGEFC